MQTSNPLTSSVQLKDKQFPSDWWHTTLTFLNIFIYIVFGICMYNLSLKYEDCEINFENYIYLVISLRNCVIYFFYNKI